MAKANHSVVFDSLRQQWASTAASRRLAVRMGEWSAVHPILAEYEDGADLVAAAETSCEVLEALAAEAATDELAMTATLVALMPRLAFLVNRSDAPALDLDERCATIMAIAHETVVKCRPGTASSWYDRRLWCNISKRYRRWVDSQLAAVDARAERLGEISVTGLEGPIGGPELGDRLVSALRLDPEPISDEFAMAELCDWVAERASVDLSTARLIVMTRAGGVPVEALVGTEGTTAQTIRRRRLRAEQRLASAMAAA